MSAIRNLQEFANTQRARVCATRTLKNAAEERLRAKGYGKKVAAITKDRLCNILKLAHDKGLLDDTLYRQADDI